MESERGSVFVARQPVLDRQRRLVAYELLFRSSADAVGAQIAEPSLATARVAVDAFLSMGVSAVLGPHRGFLNVDLEMLASEAIEVLPADRIVLEILETTPVWARERCIELRRRGFELALDDFVPGDDRAALLDVVDYVKVDLVQTDRAALQTLVRELGAHRVRLIAEKVETMEEFERCASLGFELFQGYFFAKPKTLSARKQDPERGGLLAAFRAISEDGSRGELEYVFKRHARLGVQLLRIANSVAAGPVQRIRTFEHAIMYVGRQPLRRWLLLMLYASSGAEARTSPTLELAALRGRMLELLAPLACRDDANVAAMNDRAFLTGVLSLGDAILGVKLGDVMDELQVEPEVRSAILEHAGPLGRMLRVAEAIEAGRFEELAGLLQSIGISAEQLAHAQREAYVWYLQMRTSETLAA